MEEEFPTATISEYKPPTWQQRLQPGMLRYYLNNLREEIRTANNPNIEQAQKRQGTFVETLGKPGEALDTLDKSTSIPGIPQANVYNARHFFIDPAVYWADKFGGPAASIGTNIFLEMLIPDTAAVMTGGFSKISKYAKLTKAADTASNVSKGTDLSRLNDIRGAEIQAKVEAATSNKFTQINQSERINEIIAESGISQFLRKNSPTEKLVSSIPVTARQNLDNFIKINSSKLKTEIINIQGQEIPVRLFRGTKEELLEKVQKYIRLNEALGIKQSKKDWDKNIGTLIGDDGFPLNISGGRKDSKGPLRLISGKSKYSRDLAEAVTPTGFKYKINGVEVEIPVERGKPTLFNAKGEFMVPKEVHKHHVAHVKATEPFGLLPDGSLRPLEQRQRITARLAKEEGIFFGNQDYNEIYLSKPAHLGKRGDKGSLAVHRMLESVTDIQGFGDWRSQAAEIFVTGGKYGDKGQWIKNIDNLPDGVSITQYKMGVKDGSILPGTYIPGQRHGFSQELLKKISKMKTDDEVISAIKTFYNESGMMDSMQGAAAIAQYATDGGVTGDLLTSQFWKTKKPQMTEFAKILLQDEAYKNNEILKEIASGNFK